MNRKTANRLAPGFGLGGIALNQLRQMKPDDYIESALTAVEPAYALLPARTKKRLRARGQALAIRMLRSLK